MDILSCPSKKPVNRRADPEGLLPAESPPNAIFLENGVFSTKRCDPSDRRMKRAFRGGLVSVSSGFLSSSATGSSSSSAGSLSLLLMFNLSVPTPRSFHVPASKT
jgi:hypothetical protein